MNVAARWRGHRETVTGTAPAVAVVADRDAPLAPARPWTYVGLVTRLLAFGVDGAIINGVAIVTGALAALAFSLFTLPGVLKAVAVAVGGAVYFLWVVGYFVTFWSTTGQTPGSRLLRIRVIGAHGEALKPRRALVRFVGLTLAALPFFLGYALILVDDRRRGLQDVLARTVVVDAPRERPARRRGRAAQDRA